jgi:hypothetical protein
LKTIVVAKTKMKKKYHPVNKIILDSQATRFNTISYHDNLYASPDLVIKISTR